MSAAIVQNTNQPVRQVYSDYKTAVWNVLIQEKQLDGLKTYNNWIEIPLAVLASSAVINLTFWEAGAGIVIWKVLTFLVAIIAVIKPFLKIPERIEQRSKMLSDYLSLENELEKIKKLVEQQGAYDAKLQAQYNKILDKKAKIREKYSGDKYMDNSDSVKEKCRNEVERRLPPGEFFFPKN